ncbi:unnamed protein product [Prorocentrum cordatum]|uniref:Uncharacterized protein n=1 Tax=Prorocentrum cordatum TaxID=2364126 RepID=A0ABN9S4B2_9DINO|nr:unnamed protein product [Polarella glacialis]
MGARRPEGAPPPSAQVAGPADAVGPPVHRPRLGRPAAAASPARCLPPAAGRSPRAAVRRGEGRCSGGPKGVEHYKDPSSVVLPPLPKFPEPDFEADRARSLSPARSPPRSTSGPFKTAKGTWVDHVASLLSERASWSPPLCHDGSRPSTVSTRPPSTSARARQPPRLAPFTPRPGSQSARGHAESENQISGSTLPSAESRVESSNFDAGSRGSASLLAVHAWWSPVEEAQRSRCPTRLEESLKSVHGQVYNRTVRRVRRSTSLRAQERHALEMEMAARLMRARALLGKWQVGMQEIRAARKARRSEALAVALEKWGFCQEPELVEAEADVRRWREMQETHPLLLHQALEARDIPRLRQVVGELNDGGPADVEELETAQRLLSRYDAQAKALADSVDAGSARSISLALQAWEFDKQDPHALAARQALSGREAQKAVLRSVTSDKNGPGLKEAVAAWAFEAQDEDFIKAVAELQAYEKAARELRRLLQPPVDLPGLAAAVAGWAFSPQDALLKGAQDRLAAFEAALREAMAASDGWSLQRLWD